MQKRLPGVVLASVVLALTASGVALAADPPPPLTVAGLTGPRSLALGGGVGLPTGTEALYVNPAALAARKRYVLEGLYLFDARPGAASPANRAQYFGGALADSQSTELAAGLSFLRAMKGTQTGNVIHLALAGPISRSLFVGLTGKYYSLSGAERAKSTLNMDVGLFWQVAQHLSIGGAAYNVIANDKDRTMPQEYGAGIAVGSETSLQVTGDWRLNNEVIGTDGRKRSKSKYGGGVEYLLDNLVPLRGGFQVDDVSKTKWWSAGIGLVTTQAAIDVGYRQSLDKNNARTIMFGVRGFLPNE